MTSFELHFTKPKATRVSPFKNYLLGSLDTFSISASPERRAPHLIIVCTNHELYTLSRSILEKWFIINSEPCCISLPTPKLINLRPYLTRCSKPWTRSSIIVATYSLAEDERFELPCSFPRPLSRRVLYQLSESSKIFYSYNFIKSLPYLLIT